MKAYLSVVLMVIMISKMGAACSCQEEDAASIKNLAIAQCSLKHQISNEAFESIVRHEHVPGDREVKCWLSCVMKKLGMMQEGKIDWEHSKNLLKHDLTTQIDKAKVDKIAEICRAQVTEEEKDECELAYSASVCKIKNWKELGLPQGNIKQ